jgi:hypothetical protein
LRLTGIRADLSVLISPVPMAPFRMAIIACGQRIQSNPPASIGAHWKVGPWIAVHVTRISDVGLPTLSWLSATSARW